MLTGEDTTRLIQESERCETKIQAEERGISWKESRIITARKKKEVEKMMILQEISYYGLWQSESQIERNLATFEAKGDMVDGLKAQLHFRKEILQQPPPSTHDKSVYNFTVVESQGKRKELTVVELTENVKVLVQAADELAQRNPIREADPLSRQRIKHKFEGDIWYDGEVISRFLDILHGIM